ncbi:hypothetical protein HZS_7522 [Henneguya salminicola]|nr:hypothetical protein HZS_7522 [Henneguya salminicola]
MVMETADKINLLKHVHELQGIIQMCRMAIGGYEELIVRLEPGDAQRNQYQTSMRKCVKFTLDNILELLIAINEKTSDSFMTSP